MTIQKILNNNALICIDADGTEKIAMGRGIAFQRKVGTPVPQNLVEKVFVPHTEEMKSRFQQVISEIPIEHILLTEKIISFAKKSFKKDLHDSIYVSLPDHISTALERHNQNMVLKNPLLADIQRFYPEEYAIAEKALDFVQEETGVRFEKDEVGFIAMHFVNAELNTDMESVYNITRTMDEIVEIVRQCINCAYTETNFAWYRFLTHVRFFVQRLFAGEDYTDRDFELLTIAKNAYPESFQCVEKISDHILQKQNHKISKEEMAYLTIHIQRLKEPERKKEEG